ncbi:threonine synthase [Antarcticibacterium flavum]|uniref:Threonine synthase n=1 Tax=Antarcticibacterium flavum TaxID=2058175 RepID=A0A5B7X1T2_9FLAO|nr:MULTISPECIES: threonine synthase [Antarcticibacterium]MCM4158739.1 threonine synthase [Antarcticibacterium sp. W02-3]QCY68591.1 threonine synthase [Antarcticibacterium flavum]
MRYFSLNDHSITASFEEAVVQGIARDRGLFFPKKIPRLPASFFEEISIFSSTEIAKEVISPFIGEEIPEEALIDIIEKTLDFDFPVNELEPNVSVLELFHGPTLAFKDVGAKFMAGCLEYFIKKGTGGEVTVLVATSGDTGGAVANGFLGVEGIKVVILYPSGKVSELQERQLTTLGRNITALEVDGAFDECQDMVKTAFLDREVTEKVQLTSANSINIARWLPQMFYYFLAWKDLKEKNKKLVFSIPSGNFGNICAGLMAAEMGLPIDHFVASTNANDVVPAFLSSGKFSDQPSVATISNAMDVGNPSNFVRILEMFENNMESLKKKLSAFSFDDDLTKDAMKAVYHNSNYIMDPHGAVGYLGLRSFLKKNKDFYGVFLETAHPVKFADTVKEATGREIEIPSAIADIMNSEKKAEKISTYEDLKSFLLR